MSKKTKKIHERNKEVNRLKAVVLDFIKDYHHKNQYPPAQREIAKGVYLSRSGVRVYLRRLEYDRKIDLIDGIARGIRILEP